MFKNRSRDGLNNRSGKQIAKFRKKLGLSQRELADQMQLINLDIGKNGIQQIESGQRFVTDIEIAKFAQFFKVDPATLLNYRFKPNEDISYNKVAENKIKY